MRKIICILMITVMLTAVLFGCTQKESPASEKATAVNTAASAPTSETEVKAEKLFSDPVELSLFFPSAENWPYQEDWFVIKQINEQTNVTLKAIPIPNASFNEKVSMTIASGEIPDIMYIYTDMANRYGPDGAFINILQYENEAPNFSKWRKANQSKIMSFLSANGKMYQYPANEIGEANRQGWLYRKDIFEKHNLQVPQNEDEFYQVCKKLKELYPESFPFIFRNGLTAASNKFIQMTPSWGADFSYFLDSKDNTWKYGPIEDGFKNLVAFMNKLYAEKLIPTDFLTIDTKAWSDRVSAEQSFITYDFLTRIDSFNIPMKEKNPEFTMYYMPPFKGGNLGINKDAYTSFLAAGFCISSQSKKLKEAVKYLDWMYTDEAVQLLSWGVEGETYKVEGGKKKIINYTDTTDLRKKTGLSTPGTYARFDYNSHISMFSPEMIFAFNEDKKFDMNSPIPSAFTSDEQEIASTTGQAIDKHRDEMIAKFIIGQRSMSEWEKYAEEIKNLGLDKMLEIYNKSYERLKKAIN